MRQLFVKHRLQFCILGRRKGAKDGMVWGSVGPGNQGGFLEEEAFYLKSSQGAGAGQGKVGKGIRTQGGTCAIT